MLLVGESSGRCGRCGAELNVDWDLDMVDSREKDMGMNNFYESETEVVCENCGNHIEAKFWISEYPEGTRETGGVIIQREEAENSVIEEPVVEFFDL